MQYLRLYTGPDGESHFADVDVPLRSVEFVSGRAPADVATAIPATALNFAVFPAGWDSQGYYNAPRRNFFILLAGELEIEASDGERRRLGMGAVLLAEDTTGTGHISRAGGSDVVMATVAPVG